MYGCESWTVKKAERWRIDAFELWCWIRLLRSLGLQGDPNNPFWRRSAFFTVQLSQPYMTTGKTIALTKQTLVGKVMSVLLNMQSRLVITFLPRSKRLLNIFNLSPHDLSLFSFIYPYLTSVFVYKNSMKWKYDLINVVTLLSQLCHNTLQFH